MLVTSTYIGRRLGSVMTRSVTKGASRPVSNFYSASSATMTSIPNQSILMTATRLLSSYWAAASAACRVWMPSIVGMRGSRPAFHVEGLNQRIGSSSSAYQSVNFTRMASTLLKSRWQRVSPQVVNWLSSRGRREYSTIVSKNLHKYNRHMNSLSSHFRRIVAGGGARSGMQRFSRRHAQTQQKSAPSWRTARDYRELQKSLQQSVPLRLAVSLIIYAPKILGMFGLLYIHRYMAREHPTLVSYLSIVPGLCVIPLMDVCGLPRWYALFAPVLLGLMPYSFPFWIAGCAYVNYHLLSHYGLVNVPNIILGAVPYFTWYHVYMVACIGVDRRALTSQEQEHLTFGQTIDRWCELLQTCQTEKGLICEDNWPLRISSFLWGGLVGPYSSFPIPTPLLSDEEVQHYRQVAQTEIRDHWLVEGPGRTKNKPERKELTQEKSSKDNE